MDLLSNQKNKNVELPGAEISFHGFDRDGRQEVLDYVKYRVT